MRVSLFGLFFRSTSLMEPWPKPVRSVLIEIDFVRPALCEFRRYLVLPYLLYFSSLYLLLSYYTMCILCWMSPAISLLFLYTCTHNTIFYVCLWFGFIDTRVLIYARHLAFASPLAGEFWLPWILMSGLGVWSLWILPVTDLRGAAVAWIPSRPSSVLSF